METDLDKMKACFAAMKPFAETEPSKTDERREELQKEIDALKAEARALSAPSGAEPLPAVSSFQRPSHAFVFDVESVGLQGEAFSVGGVIVGLSPDGPVELLSFHLWSSPNEARGTADDFTWITANVPTPIVSDEDLTMFHCREDVMEEFWRIWMQAKTDYPGIIMAAECQWPVEARFLLECVDRNRELRNWEGPYPLHDVASFLLAAGMDPMAAYERRGNEQPAHNPLADARLSARLMHEAFKRIWIKN